MELGACKSKRAPPPPTPAPPPVDSVAEGRRQARLELVLGRAHTLWQARPNLANCPDVLREKADVALCHAAADALGAVEQVDPRAAPESALPALANGSLALVRLLDRARYLNFEDFGRRRLEADGGAPAVSGSAPAPPFASATPSASLPKTPQALHVLLRQHQALKLGDSPLAQLVESTARLEHDVLRNLSAYLEYAPLPVRQTAFESVKQLQAQHPHWPTLSHVLREAAVLETDGALKQKLTELMNLGVARGPEPDQPTGSK